MSSNQSLQTLTVVSNFRGLNVNIGRTTWARPGPFLFPKRRYLLQDWFGRPDSNIWQNEMYDPVPNARLLVGTWVSLEGLMTSGAPKVSWHETCLGAPSVVCVDF